MAQLFGVSECYLPYVFYHVAVAVAQQLQYEISWPDVEERAFLASLLTEYEDIIGTFNMNDVLGFVDCSKVYTGRPLRGQSRLVRRDKPGHGYQMQAVVDHFGYIRHLVTGYVTYNGNFEGIEGRDSDMGTLTRTLLLPERRKELFASGRGDIRYRLMVDGGYNVRILYCLMSLVGGSFVATPI